MRKLREALEPNAAMISDIPAFDVALGHELYSLLLKPVEAGWKQSKSLIVVTNGALGLLPLSLLPTAPAQIAANEDVLFASYRDRAVARAHPCGDDGAVVGGAADPARTAAGQARAQRADRVRRPVLLQGAARRGDEAGAGGGCLRRRRRLRQHHARRSA